MFHITNTFIRRDQAERQEMLELEFFGVLLRVSLPGDAKAGFLDSMTGSCRAFAMV